MKRIALVLGTRPQIIKSAPIISYSLKESEIDLQIIHTGQHYDYEMSKAFFSELELSNPITNLGVGSGPHGWQTGMMLIKLEKFLTRHRPDVLMVPGDTNSTLAGALAAAKLQIPLAHVEAGARSHDMRMPEEVNRKVTDHCSQILFAPTENCVNNLINEGIIETRISLVGDTMYDVLLRHFPKAMKSEVLEKIGLQSEEYAVLTMHRVENVDDSTRLGSVVKAITYLKEITFVFPVHPRTRKQLEKNQLTKILKNYNNVKLTKPFTYHEMLKLVSHSKLVMTDSGGLQKEAFWLGTPCITLRENTEWVETIKLGANALVGCEVEKIVQKAREYISDQKLKDRIKRLSNPFGDGRASERIVDRLKRY